MQHFVRIYSMENETLDMVINDYIKFIYPIRKYKIGRRFIKGVKRGDKIFSLKALDQKKKLYHLICEDLNKVMGFEDEITDMVLLRYLKFF